MLISGLFVGIALGFALQRGRFCMTGAFRDVWVAKRWRWFTAFLIAITVHSIGFWALVQFGVLTVPPETFPWIATIVGGLIFGVGIVYAGGCATGTYYRAAEGLIGSWVALALYALSASVLKNGPLAPVTEAFRGIELEQGTLYGLLGVSPWILVAALTLVTGVLVRRELAKPKLAVAKLPAKRTGLARILFEKPWGAFPTAIVVGIIATIAWPLSAATGRNGGLGITTPSANLVSYLGTGDAELVDWGVFLIVGIFTGAAIAAIGSREFRLRVPDAKTFVRSAFGGVLMGVGAAWAGGCTIGNALVGTATFTLQGWVSLVAMVLGVGIAARFVFSAHFARTGSKGGGASGSGSAGGSASGARAGAGSLSSR